ncbi:MAG: tetratricopeptide repeat protein [Planctomycetota bacterium]|nr:MAG: tetratricopeptide repeat protein [Planctomycetota bacterium]
MKHLLANLTVFAACMLIISLAFADEPKPGDAVEKAATQIEWKTSWEDAAATAKDESRLILMLFANPDDSSRCRKMDKNIWVKASVAGFVNETFVPLRIHTAKVENRPMMKEFKVDSVPVILILNADKKVIVRKSYYKSSRKLLAVLKKAASVPAMEKMVKENSEDADAAYELAKIHLDLGCKDDAKPLLEKVCELDADNASGKKIHALFLLAGFDLTDGKYDDAKKKFDEIKKLDPEDKAGYRDDIAFQLAILSCFKNDYAEAIEKLEKFLKDFPKSKLRAEALYHLGASMLLSKNEEGAKKIFNKLNQDYPKTKYGKQATQMLKQIEQLKKLREAPRRTGG